MLDFDDYKLRSEPNFYNSHLVAMESNSLTKEQENFKQKVEQEVKNLGIDVDEFDLERIFLKHFECEKNWDEVLEELLSNKVSSNQLNKLKNLKSTNENSVSEQCVTLQDLPGIATRYAFSQSNKEEEKKIEFEAIDNELHESPGLDLMSIKQSVGEAREMPACAEKTLIQVLDLLLKSDVPNLEILKPEISKLGEQLKTEEFNETVIAKFKTFADKVNKSSWSSARDELAQILKLVRPLHIQEIVSLTEKAITAGTILKGKKIFLFLGATGAGKSTTIHYLCGSSFQEELVDGLRHLLPTDIKNPDLRNVTTSPYARSETRCITAVSLDEEYVLCDTPGFEDTSGAEVDIANGIGVVKAIKQCEEVKPILLISYRSLGDRFQGLKKLARTLTTMLPSFTENMKSISYFFTKFPQKERDTLKASLENVRKNLTAEEKFDAGFVKFFDDLIFKAKKKKQIDIQFIDPSLEDEADDILQDLKGGHFINIPADKFQTYITQDSRAILDKQLAVLKNSISEGFQRRDYKYVDYRLSELKKLYVAIEVEDINQQYKDSVAQITKQLNEEYKKDTQALERQISQHNELKREDIQLFIKAAKHLENAKCLIEHHLKEQGVVQADSYYQFLRKQTSRLVTAFKEDFSNLSTNFQQLQSILGKINLLTDEFKDKEMTNDSNNALDFLSTTIKESRTDFDKYLANQAYDQVALKLNELRQLLELASPYFKLFTVQELENEVIKRLQEQTVNTLALVSFPSSLQTKDLGKIVDWSKKLTLAEHQFNHKEIKQIAEDFASEILKCAQLIEKEINAHVSGQVSEGTFKKIERPFRIIAGFREIPKTSSDLHPIYWNTFQTIVLRLEDSNRNAQFLIQNIFDKHTKEDSENLKKYLENLETAKWIDEFATPKVCDNVSTKIKDKLSTYVANLLTSLGKIENYQWLEELILIRSKINALEPLKEIAGLGETSKRISEKVEKSINEILMKIEKEYSTDKITDIKPGLLDAQKADYYINALNLAWGQNIDYEAAKKAVDEYLSVYFTKIGSYLDSFVPLKDELNEKFITLKAESLNNSPKKSQPEISEEPQSIQSLEKALSDFRDKAKKAARYIEELKTIEKEHRNLRKYFKGDPMKDFLNEIRRLREELEEEIKQEFNKNRSIETIGFILQIIQNLKGLDDVIEDEKFYPLYLEYHQKFHQNASNFKDEAIDDLKEGDIESGIVRMKELETTSQQQFLKAKRFLTDYIENIVVEVEDALATLRFKDVSLKKIRQIADNLSLLEKAKKHIPKNYIPSSFHKIGDCIEDSIRTIFSKIERYTLELEVFVKCSNPSLVLEKVDHIERVMSIFRSYFTKEQQEILEILKKKISNYQKEGGENLLKDYEERDLSEYVLYPPSKILDNTSENLTIKQVELKKLIADKFDEALKKASQGTLDAANAEFTKIESAMLHLPQDLKTHIQAKLEKCKKEVQSRSTYFEARFNDMQNSKRLSGIYSLFEEQEKDGIKDAMQKIMQFVIQQIEALKLEFESNLESWESTPAFNKLHEILDYTIKFGSKEGFDEPLQKIVGNISKTLEASFHHLHTTLSTAFSKEVILDFDILQKQFECFLSFKEFGTYLSSKSKELEKIWLPRDFEAKYKELLTQISSFLKQKMQTVEDAINPKDVSNSHAAYLSNTIENLQKWDSFLVSLQQRNHFIIADLINIQNLPTIKEVGSKLVASIKEKKMSILSTSSMNPERILLQEDRDGSFIQLNSAFSFLQNASKIKLKIEIDVASIIRECLQETENKLNQIAQKARKHLEIFLSSPFSAKLEAEKFHHCYQVLLSFQQHVKVQIMKPNLDDFEDIISTKVREYEYDFSSKDFDYRELTESLKKIKHISNNLPYFKERVDKYLDGIFEKIKMRTDGNVVISRIGALLNTDMIGGILVSEHKVFEGFSLSIFNRKVETQDINYVLKNLRSSDKISREKLEKRFRRYEEKYKEIVQNFLGKDIDYNKIISQLKILVGSGVIDEEGQLDWDQSMSDKIPDILAFIFAIWTLSSSSHYFEASNPQDREYYLFQPHPAQVISIFRIFGVGDDTSRLQNNLIQIGTGEGKSLILAATSVIFALLGFDVSCACYSEYLSRRDFNAFKSLFNTLNVASHIQYGTFNQLCENVINQNGDIRRIVEALVSGSSNINSKQKTNRQKILLIDEVDVFFKKDFYGNIYTPSACLKDDTITELITYIWENKNSLSLNKVKQTTVFQNCRNKYSGWEALIEEAVKDMISDVRTFESHDYFVQNDKIGYKEQDGMSFNVTYGYKTLFAYFREYENKNISKASLLENICIRLKCGHYSYAEMPKEFSFIMGVTGTLETLSPIEKKVIADKYKITKYTYTPSVFGSNDLKFSKSEDIKIENESDYYNRIVQEINDRLIGKTGSRAVLVFFESEEKLVEFRDSRAFSALKGLSRYLTEKANIQEKEYFVKQAMCSGQVSLLTRSFGRGTDFVCHDPIVGANGGVHVIQTFLSEEISEEVQIRGRTARQGGQGSYSLVLLDQSLEKFMITTEQIKSMVKRSGSFWEWLKGKSKTIYDHLNELRCEVYKTKYDDSSKFVAEAAAKHNEGLKFIKNLISSNISSAKDFLLKLNRGVVDTKSRTICLLDATGSMSNLLHKAKTTVGIMFDRAFDIMNNNQVSSNFQIQFAVFRNYNSKEDKILQVSTWEAQPENLKMFMEKIGPEGGDGNEAIEIGLWHAHQENMKNSVSQIILIGDAPPNTIDEVKSKRTYFKSGYWDNTKFRVPTHWKEQLQNLKGIPIHTFYVNDRAKSAFNEIANFSGGQCKFLDVNSSEGAHLLTDCVTETILKNVGELVGKGDKLVIDYKNKYSKAFSK